MPVSGDRPDASHFQLLPHPGHDGEGESEFQDTVIPTASKFGFARPSDPYYTQRLKSPDHRLRRLSASAAVSGSPTEETTARSFGDRSRATSAVEMETPSPFNRQQLSRAFSMPLPSQLGHLQNPCRSASSTSPPEPSAEAGEDITQFQELSLELADSVQMIVQTLLQISPPQILDPAKEQFCACSVSFPTSAVSAMFTSMKSLNYMSANMSAFCAAAANSQRFGKKLDPPFRTPCQEPNDFDIGELLQNVGDALSGAAAEAGVDVILYHGDVALKHVVVRGDESGIAYALAHIARRIIGVASRGDAIEIGLFFTTISGTGFTETPSPSETSEQLQCTLDIYHKFVAPDSPHDSQDTPPPIRPPPAVKSLLLQRLLSHLGASLTTDKSPKPGSVGRVCALTLKVDRGSQSDIDSPPMGSPSSLSDVQVADEPTLEELVQFTERLRGKKATLYASAKGSFAHHLTSYLTAWGLDVSHASGEVEVDEKVKSSETTPTGTELTFGGRPPFISPLATAIDTPPTSSAMIEDPPQLSKAASFIMIDDDVTVLKERLRAFHNEQNNLFQVNLRKHTSPTLHWTRTSPQVTRSVGPQFQLSQSSVVVIHFTSLANYKVIKDVVQSDLSSYTGTQLTIPEVMIIPKPAGPRRVLTALYTAVTKPAMDPYFSPIATAPITPNLHGKPTFFNYHHPPQKSPTNRPAGSRANSDRSARSVTGDFPMAIPSPLTLAEGKDYFPEGSSKLGVSPASGLVIQSPDGQPAGIFFLPKAKASWNPPAALSMERDKGQLGMSPERRASMSPQSPRVEAKPSGTFSPLAPATTSAPDHRDLQPNPSNPPARLLREPRHGFEEQAPSRPAQFVAPASRMLSIPEVATRRTVSDPISPLREGRPVTPASIPRKSVSKRRSAERQPSSQISPSRAGKGTGDGNIVPPISVLIVDDNPINQTILSTFMKKKQIKYDVAKNGQEAVQKWRTGGFHLILMDIQMPVMDGIQATKEIRRAEKENALAGYPPLTPPAGSSTQESRSLTSPYRSSVIIVALTASSLQSDRVAALAAGCNDFLTKPVSLIWLNNKIIEWGSIKALQMWADVRSDAMKSLSNGQASQARNVAERLHMPQGRSTPSPSREPGGTSTMVASTSTRAPPHFISQAPTPLSSQPRSSTDKDSESQSSSNVLTSSSEDADSARAIDAGDDGEVAGRWLGTDSEFSLGEMGTVLLRKGKYDNGEVALHTHPQ